jgi:ATP-dependent Clp protease ATP-binding subunit ClpB
LKRFLQHQLESRIGRALIAGEMHDGARLIVGVKDGGLAVEINNPEPAGEPAGAAAAAGTTAAS